MLAIGISGSPRKGNTQLLVERCLGHLSESGIGTRLVSLRGKTIRPCTACEVCAKTLDRTCAIKDDDFHGIFESMLEASIIVTASPVYYGSATPELMALLDRAGYVAQANGYLLSRKIGGPLVVARRAGQNFTLAQLVYWYLINDMVVAGSSYWNIAFGREAGEVLDDTEGLETVRRFAENLAWLAGKLEG